MITATAAPASQVSIGPGLQSSERPAVTYRLLGSNGFRTDEAGNLTAYLHGLSPVEGGWDIGEIEHLLLQRCSSFRARSLQPAIRPLLSRDAAENVGQPPRHPLESGS